jgi:hypothetical protein
LAKGIIRRLPPSRIRSVASARPLSITSGNRSPSDVHAQIDVFRVPDVAVGGKCSRVNSDGPDALL